MYYTCVSVISMVCIKSRACERRNRSWKQTHENAAERRTIHASIRS